MQYKCEACGSTYNANDSELLSMLPPDVAALYPVLPRYAHGSFHFHKDLSDNLELLMQTYANAKFVSAKLYKKNNTEYLWRLETYLSQQPTVPFVPLDGFAGSIFPPSANSIWNYFLAAEESCLQPYGYSNISCYEQEIQSVEIKPGETVAFDWTFQAIKNYSSLPGAKCIFTALNGTTKEIVTAAMVSTTAVREIAHLLVNKT